MLDVGCGLMPYKSIIMGHGKVSEYLGMDLNQASYHGIIPPDIIWDGNNIPLSDSSINSVLATEFLEHYHDTNSILNEIYRVLNQGGLLFGTVPFIWNLHEVTHDEYRFTPFSFAKHLERSGFKNIEIKALSGPDLAMEQMMGLWFSISYFRGKKYLKWPFFWIYKWLLKRDKPISRFDSHKNSLYNGLSFKAYK
jgi:SAM-dependent methyltransferase